MVYGVHIALSKINPDRSHLKAISTPSWELLNDDGGLEGTSGWREVSRGGTISGAGAGLTRGVERGWYMELIAWIEDKDKFS